MARSVLELPSVNVHVGSGATDFAVKQGFCMEDNHLLLSEMTIKAYEVVLVAITNLVTAYYRPYTYL